ncbi:MAG: C40 family peptidase, partial [Candidatus Pacebacteria bacterium]|nr:C40 family peptidase [Candidatus Paceibacterota bacterium]
MSGNFALKGKVVKIANKKNAKRFHSPARPAGGPIGTMEPALGLSNVIKEAEKYLGAKYVLGGKSKKGIDCSGLVQVAYKNSLNIILPKHSWDQKKMGKKVKLE